jgi:hypothetical protein
MNEATVNPIIPAMLVIPSDDQPAPAEPPARPLWESLILRGNPPDFPSSKVPVEVLADALELRAELVDELVAAIEKADADLGELMKAIPAYGGGGWEVSRGKRLNASRAVWIERLADACAILGTEPPTFPPSPWQTSFDFCDGGKADARNRIQGEIATARAKLKDAEYRIAECGAILADDERYRGHTFSSNPRGEQGCQDLTLGNWSIAWQQKRELEARIAQLDQIESTTAAAIIERFEAAVRVAQGRENLVEAVWAALTIIPPADLIVFDVAVRQAENDHQAATNALYALTSHGIDAGPMVDDATQSVTDAHDRIMAARTERSARFKAHATALIDGALQADEVAMIKLEQLVNDKRTKFFSPVAKAILAARLGTQP